MHAASNHLQVSSIAFFWNRDNKLQHASMIRARTSTGAIVDHVKLLIEAKLSSGRLLTGCRKFTTKAVVSYVSDQRGEVKPEPVFYTLHRQWGPSPYTGQE